MSRSASEAKITEYCPKCEKELDDNGNCPKHWPPQYERITQFRRQTVVNRVAQRTSIADDLLTVSDSPIGSTVERLLDALAGLVASTAATKSKNPDQPSRRSAATPPPPRQPVWADMIQQQVDNQLWELTENVASFLNRPTDPRSWSVCDVCGNRRLGESTYCQTCGSRILDGARRCRQDGCPNENGRRTNCPPTHR